MIILPYDPDKYKTKSTFLVFKFYLNTLNFIERFKKTKVILVVLRKAKSRKICALFSTFNLSLYFIKVKIT